MKRFQWDQASFALTAFDSRHAWITHLARSDSRTSLVCIQIEAGGIVGHHETLGEQLFIVVSGSGWVRGEAAQRYAIQTGQAAYWREGEWHEAGSDAGMSVIIIESDRLQLPPKLVEITDES
jgi:quercetin dioxygenase-like cupin family protein